MTTLNIISQLAEEQRELEKQLDRTKKTCMALILSATSPEGLSDSVNLKGEEFKAEVWNRLYTIAQEKHRAPVGVLREIYRDIKRTFKGYDRIVGYTKDKNKLDFMANYEPRVEEFADFYLFKSTFIKELNYIERGSEI